MFFRRFNLGYLSSTPFDFSFIQATFSYPLWRLHSSGGEWISEANLSALLPPPDLHKVENMVKDTPYWNPENIVLHTVIRPLIDWGFIEVEKPDPIFEYTLPSRTTPIFRDAIQFDFGVVENP